MYPPVYSPFTILGAALLGILRHGLLEFMAGMPFHTFLQRHAPAHFDPATSMIAKCTSFVIRVVVDPWLNKKTDHGRSPSTLADQIYEIYRRRFDDGAT
jgi:hypothetical protein